MKKETAYFVVNSLTMARASSGLGTVIAAVAGEPITATAIWFAGWPTELDGTVARHLKVNSSLGELRDSLADLAHSPAGALSLAIFGHNHNASPEYIYGWIALAAFVCLIHGVRVKKAWPALAAAKINSPNL